MAKLPNYYKVSIDGLNVKLEPIYEELVEVVRCKDCKSCSHDAMFGGYWCGGRRVKADDFCSYGERRTDNEDNSRT